MQPEKSMAMIFLYAENALDRLNWNFVIQQLEVIEMGERFIRSIKTIYTKQKAKIKINGDYKRYSNTERYKAGLPMALITIYTFSGSP